MIPPEKPLPMTSAVLKLIFATALLYLALAGLSVWFYFITLNTNEALCVFRTDLQRRADSAQSFLVEHPKGIPGISAKVIQQGITNQRATLRALESLNC